MHFNLFYLFLFHCTHRYYRANSVRYPTQICEGVCALNHFCAITRVDYREFRQCLETATGALSSSSATKPRSVTTIPMITLLLSVCSAFGKSHQRRLLNDWLLLLVQCTAAAFQSVMKLFQILVVPFLCRLENKTGHQKSTRNQCIGKPAPKVSTILTCITPKIKSVFGKYRSNEWVLLTGGQVDGGGRDDISFAEVNTNRFDESCNGHKLSTEQVTRITKNECQSNFINVVKFSVTMAKSASHLCRWKRRQHQHVVTT